VPCLAKPGRVLGVTTRGRPDGAGHHRTAQDRPPDLLVLVRGRSGWVAGEGFEPWKAKADGFTVRHAQSADQAKQAEVTKFSAHSARSTLVGCDHRSSVHCRVPSPAIKAARSARRGPALPCRSRYRRAGPGSVTLASPQGGDSSHARPGRTAASER